MTKTLEEKIEERIQQAMDRNIIGKAGAVAEGLGSPFKLENEDAIEQGYCYDKGSLKVKKLNVTAFAKYDFSGRNLVSTSVQFGGEVKFYAEDDKIEAYIPGDWEKELDKSYKVVSAQAEKRAENYPLRELRERAAKFGLKY